MGRMRQVSLDALKEGAILSSPLYDDQGAKLLGAGVEVTAQLLARLRARGVNNVVVNHDDLESNDEIADLESSASVENEGPFWDQVKSHGATGYKPWLIGPTKKAYQARIKELAKFNSTIGHRRVIDNDELKAVSINTMLMAAEDIDYFTRLALEPTDDPTKANLNIAMLAVAMGINLGLGCEALIDLGCGCLLKDIGPMNGSKWANVAPRAKICALQIDERSDGSGSPRGVPSDQIHLLARIAGVAKQFFEHLCQKDANPHSAVVAILAELKQQRFHPASVRALLDTTSLYPIGSSVVLDDARVAEVIRAQRGKHTAPIVCIGDVESELSEVIDLDSIGVQVEEAVLSG